MKAKPEIIKMWAQRNKCWMCKHRFEEPVILPVKNPKRGKFQPNYNPHVLWHMYDTHGLPPDTVMEWIMGSIYGAKLTEVGMTEVGIKR